VLFVVSASFNNHLKIYCMSYTGYQSDNESIIKQLSSPTYQALHLQQPSYISSLLVNYIPPQTLRSTSQGLLNTPRSPTVIGARRFSSAAPVIWNKLPYTIPSAETTGTFHT